MFLFIVCVTCMRFIFEWRLFFLDLQTKIGIFVVLKFIHTGKHWVQVAKGLYYLRIANSQI
jgi:hypothetical protein